MEEGRPSHRSQVQSWLVLDHRRTAVHLQACLLVRLDCLRWLEGGDDGTVLVRGVELLLIELLDVFFAVVRLDSTK